MKRILGILLPCIFLALISCPAFATASILKEFTISGGTYTDPDAGNQINYHEINTYVFTDILTGNTIDSFTLELNVSDYNNPPDTEYWKAAVVKSESGYFSLFDINNDVEEHTFTSSTSPDWFSYVVNSGSFILYLSESTGSTGKYKDSITLTSGTLTIKGNPVPLPGAALLLAPVLLGLVGIRRKLAA